MSDRIRTLLPLLFRLLIGTGAVAAVLQIIGAGDPSRLIATVAQAGWWLALVPVPTLVAMSLDTVGWHRILRVLGQRVAWTRLLALRLSVEAVVLAAPGGSIAGEPLKASLLRRRLGVPIPAGAASLVLTKALATAGAAVYLAVAAVLAAGRDTVHAGRGGHAPMVAAALASVCLAALSALLLVGLHRRARLVAPPPEPEAPHPRRGWYQQFRSHLANVGVQARAFYRASPRTWLTCALPFLLEWFVEGCESILVLRCLSVPIGIGDALVLDGIGSVLRALAFFVPGGLGVQDGAQVLMLRLLGFGGDPLTAAAFVFTKRTKELFWIVTGGILLAGTREGMVTHAIEGGSQRGSKSIEALAAGQSPREAS